MICEVLFSQYHSKFNSNFSSNYVSQVRTKEYDITLFFYKKVSTFGVPRRTLTLVQFLLWLFLSLAGKDLWLQQYPYWNEKAGLQMVFFRRFWKFFYQKTRIFLCYSLVHWWVGCVRGFNSCCASRFSCSSKKFMIELSLLSGNRCADTMKTNSSVTNFIAVWLWSTLSLKNFTMVNLLNFYCVCWGLSGRNGNFQKTSRVNCGLLLFLKGESNLEMQTFSPFLKLVS